MSDSYCWLCNGLFNIARYASYCEPDVAMSLNPEGSSMELDGDELEVNIEDFYRGRIYRAVFKIRYCPICGREI